MWRARAGGRCPRCLEPVGIVQLADGRRYRCSMPPRLLNGGLDLDHAHERPAAHDPECPGVPRAEVAFAQMSARVLAALERLEQRVAAEAMHRLRTQERAGNGGTAAKSEKPEKSSTEKVKAKPKASPPVRWRSGAIPLDVTTEARDGDGVERD